MRAHSIAIRGQFQAPPSCAVFASPEDDTRDCGLDLQTSEYMWICSRRPTTHAVRHITTWGLGISEEFVVNKVLGYAAKRALNISAARTARMLQQVNIATLDWFGLMPDRSQNEMTHLIDEPVDFPAELFLISGGYFFM
jgi:hypothetical protein